MKRFMFSLVAAVAALILGCQTPDASNPVATGDNALPSSIAKPVPVPDPSQFGFDQILSYKESRPIPDLYRAVGHVIFHITRVPNMPESVNELFEVETLVNGDLSKVVNATTAATPAPWTFGGNSKDRIWIPRGGKVTFEKKYLVRGASVPTAVIMPFTLTERVLALRTMSLIRVKAVEVPPAATK